MKKTYTISLGGQIFHIEEDAMEKLQSYIRALENYYTHVEGGTEIINDIENRISELFQEAMQHSGKEVITLADTENAIATLGNPDDIINEDTAEEKSAKSVRKLYRDTDHNIFGGVAAGLAAYFGAPAILFRLLFLILAFFYGVTLIIYITLWIILPAAITSRQKLEMKGEKINISNIEKNIKDSYQEVKENGKIQHYFQKTGQALGEILTALGNTVLKISIIFLRILSFFLFLIALCTLVVLIGGLFIPSPGNIFSNDWFDLTIVMSYPFALLLKIALLLAIFSPLLLIIWLSGKYLFRFKSSGAVPLSLAGLWIFSLILLIFIGITQGIHFKNQRKYTTSTQLATSSQKLVITTTPSSALTIANPNHYGLLDFAIHNNEMLLWHPRLFFDTTSDEQPELTIVKIARGLSAEKAYENAQAILYNWKLQNDTLNLNSYFSLPNREKWRVQQVDLIIRVPENYTLYLSNGIQKLINFSYQSNFKGENCYYKVTPEGLQPLTD